MRLIRLVLGWLVLATGCQNDGDDGAVVVGGAADTNRPPSFGMECGGADGGMCEPPFSCMVNSSTQFDGAMQCTFSCDTDDDCPSWQATGHCAGPAQSRCEASVCQPRLCK